MLCEKCSALLADNRRMREALEAIIQECLDDIDCGEESEMGETIRKLAQQALKGGAS